MYTVIIAEFMIFILLLRILFQESEFILSEFMIIHAAKCRRKDVVIILCVSLMWLTYRKRRKCLGNCDVIIGSAGKTTTKNTQTNQICWTL